MRPEFILKTKNKYCLLFRLASRRNRRKPETADIGQDNSDSVYSVKYSAAVSHTPGTSLTFPGHVAERASALT